MRIKFKVLPSGVLANVPGLHIFGQAKVKDHAVA